MNRLRIMVAREWDLARRQRGDTGHDVAHVIMTYALFGMVRRRKVPRVNRDS